MLIACQKVSIDACALGAISRVRTTAVTGVVALVLRVFDRARTNRGAQKCAEEYGNQRGRGYPAKHTVILVARVAKSNGNFASGFMDLGEKLARCFRDETVISRFGASRQIAAGAKGNAAGLNPVGNSSQ